MQLQAGDEGCPSGLSLGLGLFRVFSSDTGCESSSPSARLQGMGELSRAEAPWQDLVMHRDLGKLEKWDHENFTRSHKAECQVLHLACGNS